MCSAGMSIFNKLAIIQLPLPITLVIIQMLFTVGSTLFSWCAAARQTQPARRFSGAHGAGAMPSRHPELRPEL